MRLLHLILATAAFFAFAPSIRAQGPTYTYFVRQIQMPDAAQWDATVVQKGTQLSPLPVNPNGARFELWTVRSNPLTSYLLDTTYVNSYVPVAQVALRSEDPYTVMPRTRADRPFWVDITVTGMSSDPTAPDAAKSVKLLRHVQAYGANEMGVTVNRANATLLSQGSLSSNGLTTLTYALTAIPGADRTKVKGEERFSVFSLADYQAPESQLASKFIQIWPLADASITGISSSSVVKATAPTVTVTLNDLYPDSYTYAHVYEGSPQLGAVAEKIPGAAVTVDSSEPSSQVLQIKDWDSVIQTDGTWTLEVVTVTPFGTERLGYTSFSVDRAIKVNGAVTSAD